MPGAGQAAKERSSASVKDINSLPRTDQGIQTGRPRIRRRRTRIGESHRAQMSIGEDGAMIVADVRGEQQPPQEGIVTHVMKVRVDNVGAWYERAQAHGARVLEPPTDREYGERECTVEDLAGHRWQFTETVRDVAPEEYGCQTVAPWPER
jgi:uncharacterized glyoxalase superfamily protein PhnB